MVGSATRTRKGNAQPTRIGFRIVLRLFMNEAIEAGRSVKASSDATTELDATLLDEDPYFHYKAQNVSVNEHSSHQACF